MHHIGYVYETPLIILVFRTKSLSRQTVTEAIRVDIFAPHTLDLQTVLATALTLKTWHMFVGVTLAAAIDGQR
jgi:hypothetical protein